jgi:protein-tyrosine phosphatase
MITWITGNVAIGEYSDAINNRLLKREKIDCILSLRGGELEDDSSFEERVCKNLGIYFFRAPINDLYWSETGDQSNVKIQVKTATYMLKLLTKKYKRILVHCTGGIDRSPCVVALWLSNKNKSYIDVVYADIKKKRPQIIEHYEWCYDKS